MTNQTPTQNPDINNEKPTPLRCLTGAIISGGLGTALSFLTVSIGQTFAAKPIHSDNVTVQNIASAVRTLVVGISALGAGIFGLVTIGLVALAIQVFIQQLKNPTPPPAQQ